MTPHTYTARPNQIFMFPYWFMYFRKVFTYRSVQIFKILCQRFYAPGSDPPHKIMRYWVCTSTLLSRWFPPDQNGQAELFCTRLVCTSSERANRRDWTWHIFAWFIGSGGHIYIRIHIYVYMHIYTFIYKYMYMYIYTYRYIYREIYIYIFMYMYTYIHVYVYLHMCIHIYTRTHVYTYTHIHTYVHITERI